MLNHISMRVENWSVSNVTYVAFPHLYANLRHHSIRKTCSAGHTVLYVKRLWHRFECWLIHCTESQRLFKQAAGDGVFVAFVSALSKCCEAQDVSFSDVIWPCLRTASSPVDVSLCSGRLLVREALIASAWRLARFEPSHLFFTALVGRRISGLFQKQIPVMSFEVYRQLLVMFFNPVLQKISPWCRSKMVIFILTFIVARLAQPQPKIYTSNKALQTHALYLHNLTVH